MFETIVTRRIFVRKREVVTLASCIIGNFVLILFAKFYYDAQMGTANMMHDRNKNEYKMLAGNLKGEKIFRRPKMNLKGPEGQGGRINVIQVRYP
jgi:hypothetical protein